jgi:hypothetical protein
MTEAEFIQIHQVTGGINTSGTINVNFDFINTGRGRVTGITVTEKPQITPSSTFGDLVRVLEEVEQIKFRVGNTLYTLQITSRRAYVNTVDDTLSFFYFNVVPFEFDFDANSTQGQDIEVSLYPFLLGSNYRFSNYNPIIDNVIEQRRVPSGSRIVESDKNNTTTSPNNLEAILSGSATLASVQESNYTSIGWSNGRYNGSKTNSKNYGGIPPAITGATFSAAIYAPQTLDSFIVSQSINTRTIQNVFHTGRGETPTYSVANTSYKLASSVGNTNTIFPIVSQGGQSITGSFDINTIIQISNEKMRIIGYTEIGNQTLITVTRGLFDTLKGSYSANTLVKIIPPTFIYKYDTIRREQNTVTNAKVWVQETENIYYTDAFGAVYTGSLYNT